MLDAGSVETTLTGRFNAAGFVEFDAANKKAIASATAAETAIKSSNDSISKSHASIASSAARSSAANDALSASNRRLSNSIPLSAMDQWSRNSAQAEKNLSKLGTTAAKGAAVGIVAVGAAAVYAAAKAVSFNQEMLRLHTQAGATTQEVVRFKAAVLSLAGTVPQSPKELSEGLYHVSSAGFKGTEALEILTSAAKGAAVGNANLSDTTNALIGILASHVKGVTDSADAQGKLNTIVGIGNTRMDELAKSIGTNVLPVFAGAGLGINDFGAALATITDNSTPAVVSATRLKQTIALMTDPSAAAAKSLASVGIGSTQLAEDLHKPNGLLVAVEDLKTHLQDSGKSAVEADQIIGAAFGKGKSSATIQTLLDELPRLRQKYDDLGKTNGIQRLNEGWAAFEKSEGASFKQLKSGAESFAITVGQVVLPELTKLSGGLAHALSGFIAEGGAAKVSGDIESVFGTIGSVVSGLAGPVENLAKALYDVGKAAGLGNAGEIEALVVAFAGFKTVGFIAPIVASGLGAIANGLFLISAAAEDGELLALPGILLSMMNPVTLVAAGLVAAVGAFAIFGGGLFSSTSAAERNAEAMRADNEAIKDLHETTQQAAEATTAAERATLAHKEALERKAKVEKEISEGKLTGRAATNAQLNVNLGAAETGEQQTQAINRQTAALDKNTTAAQKGIATAQDKQKAAEKDLQTQEQIFALHPPGSEEERNLQAEELVQLQENFNRAQQKTAQLTAEVAVRQESLNRIKATVPEPQITGANAQGVQALQNALNAAKAPQVIKTRYELEDQGAQAKLGQLAQQLDAVGQKTVVAKILTTAPNAGVAIAALHAIIDGVPSSKVISIIHNAPSAKAAMGALTGAVRAIPGDKSVDISTNAGAARSEILGIQGAIDGLTGKSVAIKVEKAFTTVETLVKRAVGHASGRGAGSSEIALVGEGKAPEFVIDASGRGRVVTEPTLLGLSPDDYVIPLEQQYRGRALGLFAQLANELDVPGYKAGRSSRKPAAKRQSMPVPNAIPPLSLPLSDIESKESAAKTQYDKAASKVTSLEGKMRTAERTLKYASPKTKAKAHAALNAVEKELNAAKHSKGYTTEHRRMEEWKRTLGEAKAFNTQINERTLEANNAANAMKLAADHNDPGAYNAAKAKRLGALGTLQGLIREAQAQVKTGTEYALQLEGQVQSAEEESQTTAGESPEQAETSEQRSGMTPAEEQQQKAIEARIALSALTAGTSDDQSAAGELVSFLTNVLGEVQAEPGPRGGNEAIIAVADALKTAQSNLASFSGTGTNENQDVQAQLNQANERAQVAQQQAQTAERALDVFGGSGDIGAGAGNAFGAAGSGNIYIQTLHPGDPATLNAIGKAAAAGFGFQGAVQSPRQSVGP